MARKQTVKLVKKKWYDIATTGHFDNVKVGETYLDDANKLIGKPIAVNVMNLTGNFKQNQITLDYTVTKLEGDKGIAEFKGYRLSPSFLKRMIRRNSTRVDHSFIARTSDGLVRLKPMIIARNHISTDLKNEVRKAATIMLLNKVASMKTEEVLANLLSSSIQRDLKKELSTLCPIKLVEVRVMEKVKSGTPLTAESVQLRGFSTKKIRKTVKRAASGSAADESEEESVDAEEDLDAMVEEDEDVEVTEDDIEVEDLDDDEDLDDEDVDSDDDSEDESEEKSDDGSEDKESEEPKKK